MPSKNFRCARCERNFLKHIADTCGPNAFVDMDNVVSRCKIPRFTHSLYGHPIVVFYNCETRQEIRYTQKEYLRLRASGEL